MPVVKNGNKIDISIFISEVKFLAIEVIPSYHNVLSEFSFNNLYGFLNIFFLLNVNHQTNYMFSVMKLVYLSKIFGEGVLHSQN